jgi:glycosyltransferase involved in cell wall biosynthesis
MVGFVEGEQKQLLIQGSNLFALTSHSENFGISVLEALVVGTPVLVTPGVGLATVIRDRELGYVADLNIDAIMQAIDRCLSDPDLAKQMGEQARQFTSEYYNWDRIAAELVGVYRSIINRRFTFSFNEDI